MDMTHHARSKPWSRRPHFSPRQLLTADQLNEALHDELMRQRLLTRALHGHGVVFGYGLTRDDSKKLLVKDCAIEVSCGLAIDRHGRMLYWDGGAVDMHMIAGKKPTCEDLYTLCVAYAERLFPSNGCAPCAKDDAQWREEGVVFLLRRGCERIDRHCPDHPEGECLSHDDYLCRRTGATKGEPGLAPDLEGACDDPGPPSCTTECGGWRYDPEACIPIACVEICNLFKDKDCDPKYSFCPGEVETYVARPFVYRTPLLYELLNCCDVDLPRVKHVSWRDWIVGDWSYRVPWDDFAARMQGRYDGFQIWFSKPIRIGTLHPGSIFLTVLVQERRADYWVAQRVPLREVRPLKEEGDCAWGVALIPDDEWVVAEITGRHSSLHYGARVEVTLRGQMLRDKCGQMLDARPLDISPHARCQGRPGDDFVTVFRVDRRPRDDDYDRSDRPDRPDQYPQDPGDPPDRPPFDKPPYDSAQQE